MSKEFTIRWIRVAVLLLVCGFSTIVTGCSATGQDQSVADEGKLVVVSSIYPLYDFAGKVGGDTVSNYLFVPSGMEPHDWEPSPSDLKLLERADVFIYNGLGMEPWAEQVLASLQNKDLIVVCASDGISLQGTEAVTDPHVWLSPVCALSELKQIKEGIIRADQENSALYEANYKPYEKRLNELHQSYQDTLNSCRKKSIVTAHEAFGYLCREYGLSQIALEGLEADSEPTPAKMSEIIRFIQEQQVKTIFYEEFSNPKAMETIAAETGAETALLNPVEGLSKEQEQSGADYFSCMEENLLVLKEALSD